MSIYNVLLNGKMNNDHINSIVLQNNIKKKKRPVRWKKKFTFENKKFASKIKLYIDQIVIHELKN